ncbi:MAG: Spy/CpxP family protein refolding chaperone [Planctomycetaceae bacterium]|nr:Spy/CpxP family protein refolding chaperone [Planctomycetaceae bacterium]
MLFLSACSGFVFAQGFGPGGGRGPGPGGPGGPGMMMGGPGLAILFSEENRQDIGLSDKQVEDIRAAFRDMRPQQGQAFPGRDATEAERQKFREQMQERLNETIKKVESILTKEQLEKSRIRAFQAGQGFGSLGMSPFAQAALDITDSQREKIRGFQQESMDKMRTFMEQNRPATSVADMTPDERRQYFESMQPKMRQFMEENRKEMETKIQGILTDAQKKLGEKFISETPDYIQKAIEAGPRGPMNRGGGGQQEPGGGYRPNAGSWRPGQGVPSRGETPEKRFPSKKQEQSTNQPQSEPRTE